MAKLFLHIGHGKTGSSYIQSSLAASLPILAERGLDYPTYREIADTAKGEISSGNRAQFLDLIEQDNPTISGDMVFSSEFFFQYLLDEELAGLDRFVAAHFSEVRVLLFIRDPVAHASSCYRQEVKVGYTRPIEFFFGNYRAPQAVNIVLDKLEAMPQVDLTIKNYSSTQDVVSVAEDWLGLERDALVRPPVDVVNRSLTRAEHEFQRQLNEHVGSAYYTFAWDLCNKLPEIGSDTLYPSLTVQEQLWQRLASDIERVNSRVTAGERYDRDRDFHEPTLSDQGLYEVSREQLGVIARIAGEEIVGRKMAEAYNQAYKRDIDRLNQQTAQLEGRALAAENQLSEVYRSSSWRLTQPLRALKSRAGRWLQRLR